MRYLLFLIGLIFLIGCVQEPKEIKTLSPIFVEDFDTLGLRPQALRVIAGDVWDVWSLSDSTFAALAQDRRDTSQWVVRSDSLKKLILSWPYVREYSIIQNFQWQAGLSSSLGRVTIPDATGGINNHSQSDLLAVNATFFGIGDTIQLGVQQVYAIPILYDCDSFLLDMSIQASIPIDGDTINVCIFRWNTEKMNFGTIQAEYGENIAQVNISDSASISDELNKYSQWMNVPLSAGDYIYPGIYKKGGLAPSIKLNLNMVGARTN